MQVRILPFPHTTTGGKIMMCYKDRTFCPFTDCICECHRKLTDHHRETAAKLGLPIAQYAEQPECFEAGVRRRKS